MPTFLEYVFPVAKSRYLTYCKKMCLESNTSEIYPEYKKSKKYYEAIKRLLFRERLKHHGSF